MNKFVLLTSLVAFSAVSGVAGAVTLKNSDKDAAHVSVEMDGKKESVTIKAGDSFDSKGKDASFTLGKHEAVAAKAADKLMISGGKIVPEVAKTEMKTETKVETKTEKTETTKAVEAPVSK